MIKRIVSLLTVLSFLSIGLSVSADVTGLTNLALGKSVEASASKDKTVSITDGEKSASSATGVWFGSGQKYITIDLEENMQFNTIAVYEYQSKTSATITGYIVEVSEDNSEWETVAQRTSDIPFAEATETYRQFLGTTTFNTVTARYVKFTVTSSTANYYIQEIEIYNDSAIGEITPPEGGDDEADEPQEDPQNFAKYKSAEVSRERDGKDHTKVTDGDKSISASANAWNVGSGEYIIIDLNTEKSFDCIVVYEYSFTRTKSYKIETSSDKSEWSTAFESDEILTGYGGLTSATSNASHYYGQFLIDMTTARYIKITVGDITESGKYAYIEEIEVYDKSNMPEIEEGEEPVDITLEAPVEIDGIPCSGENFHIYLFLGQSNMAGRGPLLKEDYVVVNDAYLLNSDGNWECAQVYPKDGSQYSCYQGYNRYSNIDEDSKNQTNPALSFTRAMRENLSSDIGIGIISNARGGTTVTQWQKDYETSDGSDNLYKKTIDRTLSALEKGGVIKGILWLQGDTDAATDGYLDRLKAMVDDMRADLNLDEEEVPFIASQFVPAKTEQNEAITAISSYVTNSDYISSEGTSSIGDDLHFDGESQRLLGCRYAEKIMSKVYGNNITSTELYNSVYNKAPDDLPDAFTVPLSCFDSSMEEDESVTVKNHLGEMQTITGHYMVILTKINTDSTDYTLTEYGISISEDGINYNQNAKSLVELTSDNAYIMLIYNLKYGKTYYFRPYSIYTDASGNSWTVNGEETVSLSVR